MAYSDKVIDHYSNPKNVGTLDKTKKNVGTGLVGAPECFAGDTLIAVPEYPGYIKIEDLYKNNKPFFVWSYNINLKKFEIKKSICVKTGHKEIVELEMDDLSSIRVTPSHRFLTLEDQYEECVNLKGKSLKSFNKTVNSRGYWEIGKKFEHLEYYRTYHSDSENYLSKSNIDHQNSNKLDNTISNLKKLDLKTHILKTNINEKRKEIDSFITDFMNYGDIKKIRLLSDEYCRFEIGNMLGLTTDKIKIIQTELGINSIKKRINTSNQNEITSIRMKNNNPYFNFSSEQKRKFASKPKNKNPKWINIEDVELIKLGNQLYVNGKLTAFEWQKYAKENKLPQNLSPRFKSFSKFKESCIKYNHKIKEIKNLESQDVYTLMVEENNNYVVLTTIELNRQSGVVVKNCGDVMRLQIEVNDNIITDAKFKTFGCGSAIAASSLATEWLKGMSIDDAIKLDNMELVEELSLPPVKIHCSVLAQDAVQSAINDYRQKQGLQELVFEEKLH